MKLSDDRNQNHIPIAESGWFEYDKDTFANREIDSKEERGMINISYPDVDNVNYLTITKNIMHDGLTDEELVESLNIPNVPVIQQTILKLMERGIKGEKVHGKLLEYSECMDAEFKVLGLCKIGHLAIYALEKLNFTEDFQTIYEKLSEEDKEQVINLRKAFEQMK